MNSGDIEAAVNGETLDSNSQSESAVTLPGDENRPLIPQQSREEEKENEALKEILNKVWMRGLPDTNQNRCKVALELWKKKDKVFTDRIDRKKKQSSDFQNEVYQLLGFYVVFQGVLLTAVAQSSLLHCNNTWTTTLLSSLASFVTVIGVTLKLSSVKRLERTIADESNTRQTLVNWQLILWEHAGEDFDFKVTQTNEEVNIRRKRQEERTSKRLWWLNASFWAVEVVLIIFSVAFVASIRQILCNPGHNP